MGLEDRDSLRVLRAAIDPDSSENDVIHQFYTRWFEIDPAIRDLFPPDM
ncbi:MAG: 2-polyprenylphenol hydroxylase, partial [Mycobacteriaceae bacterium]|nr:2-polyprenylphenol hydroxylase [Mycobacteriaceae bacterium]